VEFKNRVGGTLAYGQKGIHSRRPLHSQVDERDTRLMLTEQFNGRAAVTDSRPLTPH
jgi:hypothetical protein